ncbi:MAG: energy transducer TonB [Pseudomonadota bacterium]
MKNGCTPFAYPKESLVLNEEGINEFILTISEKGIVKEVKLSSTSGFEKLDDEAKRAFSLCKFKPAEKNGKVTESSLRVKYVWRIGENQKAVPRQ